MKHESALRASLRAEYGIDWRDAREVMGARDVADLVEWLPAGSPLWQSVGGPLALSVNARLERATHYYLQVLAYQNAGGKGRKPEMPKDPEYAHEREARERADDAKAAAYFRRQARLAAD